MEFLFSLFSIIIINIGLSGDNAIVIAAAYKKLEKNYHKYFSFVHGSKRTL